jgi:dTDP-4-amino-4,6-dideoxygalactose transaminase
MLVNDIKIKTMKRYVGTKYNYSYYPIWLEGFDAKRRNEVFDYLVNNGVMARRYFFPLISDFPMYKSMTSANPVNLPYARAASDTVICLPLYAEMSISDADFVVNTLFSGLKQVH